MLSSISTAAIPVVLREFREMGRRRRTFWLRGLYVAFPAALLGMAVFTPWISEANPENVGPRLFSFFAWMQLSLVVLVAPALTSGLISDENDRRTLEVLFSTPIKSWEVIAGKVLTRLWELGFLIIGSVPVLIAVLLLGGVAMEQVLWVFGVTLIAALFTGSLGLFLCVLLPRSGRALTSVYGLMIAWCGLAPLAALIMTEAGSGYDLWDAVGVTIFELLSFTSPFSVMSDVLTMDSGSLWFLVVPPSLSLVLITGATAMLRRAVLRVPRMPGTAARRVSPRTRPQHGRFRARQVQARTERAGKAIRGHPLVWLIMRQATAREWKRILRLVVIVLADAGCIWAALAAFAEGRGGFLDLYGFIFGFGFFIWPILALAAASYGARVFTGERQSGALDILLTTPVSNAALVWSRFWGFWRLYGPFLLAFIPCWILPIYYYEVLERMDFDDEEAFILTMLPPALLMSLSSIIMVGMWISRWAATRVRAVVIMVVGLVIWWTLKFLMTGLVAAALHGDEAIVAVMFLIFAPDLVAGGLALLFLLLNMRAPTRFSRG